MSSVADLTTLVFIDSKCSLSSPSASHRWTDIQRHVSEPMMLVSVKMPGEDSFDAVLVQKCNPPFLDVRPPSRMHLVLVEIFDRWGMVKNYRGLSSRLLQSLFKFLKGII